MSCATPASRPAPRRSLTPTATRSGRLSKRPAPPHREQYFRGVARRDGDRVVVHLTGDQGSHVLRSMADANCLIVVPQGTSEVAVGPRGEIIPLAPIE